MGAMEQCIWRTVYLVRPDSTGNTRAYFSIMRSKAAGYYMLSALELKKTFREMFQDAGWEAARMLDGVDKANDFYMQGIAQVKIEKWPKGMVALVGDAGRKYGSESWWIREVSFFVNLLFPLGFRIGLDPPQRNPYSSSTFTVCFRI